MVYWHCRCFQQITSYWLPLVRQAAEEDGAAKPVIIVGNKVSLNSDLLVK